VLGFYFFGFYSSVLLGLGLGLGVLGLGLGGGFCLWVGVGFFGAVFLFFFYGFWGVFGGVFCFFFFLPNEDLARFRGEEPSLFSKAGSSFLEI